MFARESDMTCSVARWLRRQRLDVRTEFVSPWGACDLVGLKFNQQRVTLRKKLGQTKSISSVLNAAVLLRIPDIESGTSTTLPELVELMGSALSINELDSTVDRLARDGFVVRSTPQSLQKRNGWIPLQQRLVAVELKLSRIEEVMQQARRNLGFATESFVALPMDVANRIAVSPTKWARHIDAGVGVLGVATSRCRVVIPTKPNARLHDEAVSLYCADKFWGSVRYAKGSWS